MRTFHIADWVWDEEGRAHAGDVAFKRAADEHGVKFGPYRMREDRDVEVPPFILEKGGDPVLLIYEADVVETLDIVDWLENLRPVEHQLSHLLPRIGEAADEIKRLRSELWQLSSQ